MVSLTVVSEIVQEIAMCALQYKSNLCESNPVPAMVQQCAKWEACMNRDPAVVGRAKVSAELIAEVVNSFVEPISWKTLVRVIHLSSPPMTHIPAPDFHAKFIGIFDNFCQCPSVFVSFTAPTNQPRACPKPTISNCPWDTLLSALSGLPFFWPEQLVSRAT